MKLGETDDTAWDRIGTLVKARKSLLAHKLRRSTLTPLEAITDEEVKATVTSQTAEAKKRLLALGSKLDGIEDHNQRNLAYASLYLQLATSMARQNLVHGRLTACGHLIESYLGSFLDTAITLGIFPSLREDEGVVPALVLSGHYIPLHRCHASLAVIPKQIFRRVVLKDLGKVLYYVVTQMRGLAPVLALHIPKSRRQRLTPEDLAKDYRLVANILEANPHIKGTYGAAWFMDPAVASISPHLRHLGDMFNSSGAILFDLGSDPVATSDAVWKSQTRKRLYERGEYKPRRFARLWSRAKIIDWANHQDYCSRS